MNQLEQRPDTEIYELPQRGSYDFKNVNLEDPRVWSLFARGDTKGVFQLEKQLGQDWSRKVKPRNIEELAALVSTLRPGPLECISGDTQVCVHRGITNANDKKRFFYNTKTAKDLYEQWVEFNKYSCRGDRKLVILSLDEKTGKFFKNTIEEAFHNGQKEVFRIKFLSRYRYDQSDYLKDYSLECTSEHLLFTNRGWVALKDLTSKDYFAICRKKFGRIQRTKRIHNDGRKSFRNRCFQNYQQKCVFCEWDEGTLDVHHLDGGRKIDNSIENLCFLCPNHHRSVSEGRITKEEIIEARKKYILPNTEDIQFVKFEESISCGVKDVYDFRVSGENHNYIAGSFIVHNCGMSEQYAKRKNGEEPVEYLSDSLKPILEKTYGCLIYQEQAMRISVDIAGFDLVQADNLRKAIGKKKPEEMVRVKKMFLEGADKKKVVSSKEAEEIFSWIETAVRFSFNKSHAISYAMLAYFSAYQKVHFPTEFYTSWLTYSDWKVDPKEEIYELVQNARMNGITINPPDVRRVNDDFEILADKQIIFGLSHIRGVGHSAIKSIEDLSDKLSTFNGFLKSFKKLKRNVVEGLIKSGACDCFKMTRTEMLRYLYVLMGRSESENSEEKSQLKALTPNEYKYVISKLDESGLIGSLESVIQEEVCINKRVTTIQAKIEYLKNIPSETNRQRSIWEKLYLGLSLTCSAADDFDKQEPNIKTCREVFRLPAKSKIVMHAVIDKINMRKTGEKAKNPGQDYCYLSLSDNTGAISGIVCWPEMYEQIKEQLSEGIVVTVYARKDSWKGRDQIVVNNLTVIG